MLRHGSLINGCWFQTIGARVNWGRRTPIRRSTIAKKEERFAVCRARLGVVSNDNADCRLCGVVGVGRTHPPEASMACRAKFNLMRVD
jgi:hypothetical protein